MKAVLNQALQFAFGLFAFGVFWIAARALRDLAGRWLVAHQLGVDAVVIGRRTVYVALVVAGALAALAFSFSSGNVAIAGVVAATVVASLGVQDVVRNYVSGYYLLFERHLRAGERIEIGGWEGVIQEVRLRVTLLRRDDGATVVVPNAQLFNGVVAVRPATSKPAARGRRLRKGAQGDPAEGLETGAV